MAKKKKTSDEIIAVENNSLSFSSFFKNILESEVEKYTTDCKQLYAYCYDNSIEPKNIVFDITLASYLLDVNSSDYSVSSLALSYNVKAIIPDFSDNAAKTFFEENKDYCESVFLTKVLSDRLNSLILERDQTQLLKDIEIPLSRVLVAMEREGMQVDTDGIKQFSERLSTDIASLENDIYNLAGEKFNINSPKQLGVILFEKLGLPAKKKTKTGYSTDADVC